MAISQVQRDRSRLGGPGTVVDYALGNTQQETEAATTMVLRNATSPRDALQLLDALGLYEVAR